MSAEVIGDVPKSIGIPRAIETACFRIAQEALTNTARHARASKASVTLDQHGEFLRLTIADDGVGFEVDGFVNGGWTSRALGLRGMQERAAAVTGSINIKSELGKGTEVSVVVPVRPGNGAG